MWRFPLTWLANLRVGHLQARKEAALGGAAVKARRGSEGAHDAMEHLVSADNDETAVRPLAVDEEFPRRHSANVDRLTSHDLVTQGLKMPPQPPLPAKKPYKERRSKCGMAHILERQNRHSFLPSAVL